MASVFYASNLATAAPKVVLAPEPFENPDKRPNEYWINFFAANGGANSYSLGCVAVGGWNIAACRLTLAADLESGTANTDNLAVRFRAVDGKNRPYGQINGPGLADDVQVTSKTTRLVARFRTGAASDAKSVFIWAELLDKSGKVVTHIRKQEMKLVPLQAQVRYGSWKPSGKRLEWTREVYGSAVWGRDYDKRPASGLVLRFAVNHPPNSPYSRLDKSSGVTNDVREPYGEVKPLTVIQRARWVPGATHQLNLYRVTATLDQRSK